MTLRDPAWRSPEIAEVAQRVQDELDAIANELDGLRARSLRIDRRIDELDALSSTLREALIDLVPIDDALTSRAPVG